jgi:hypothetical protein
MRHRPPDWPRHLKIKRLKGGKIAYYWELPPWAVKAQKEAEVGDPFRALDRSVALGSNYAEALERANTYNNLLDDLRQFQRAGTHATPEISSGNREGTIDWMCEQFLASRKYKEVSSKQQGEYRKNLQLCRSFTGKTGRRFGEAQVSQITAKHADNLFLLLSKGPNGPRPARAVAAMTALRRAWNVVLRLEPKIMPTVNPFENMELPVFGGKTKAASLEDLKAYVAAADELGMPSMGTAAMIAFHCFSREPDIIGNFRWADFRPGHSVTVRHHKTKKISVHELQRYTLEEGWSRPYEALEDRLLALPRGSDGALIILRDSTRDLSGHGKPYSLDLFQKHDRIIRDKCGLSDKGITFTCFRHGANTEAAIAGATDRELMSAGGRAGPETLGRYVKESSELVTNSTLKRLEYRKEQMRIAAERARSNSGTKEAEIVGMSETKEMGTAALKPGQGLKKQGESK